MLRLISKLISNFMQPEYSEQNHIFTVLEYFDTLQLIMMHNKKNSIYTSDINVICGERIYFSTQYVISRIHFIDRCLLGRQTFFLSKNNNKCKKKLIVYQYQYQHCLSSVRMENKCQYFLSLLRAKKIVASTICFTFFQLQHKKKKKKRELLQWF